MSSRISQGSTPMTCHCGKSLALVRSWTSLNPGIRFLACSDYDHSSGRRGCSYFRWYDGGQTAWQREVINDLLVDNRKLAGRLSVLEGNVKNYGVVKSSKTCNFIGITMVIVLVAMVLVFIMYYFSM